MKFSLRAPKVQVYAYAQTAIGLLLLLGGLFFAWDLISTTLKEEKKATQSRKKAEPTKSKRSFLDYRSILEKNPFGFPGGELKPISPSSSPSSPWALTNSLQRQSLQLPQILPLLLGPLLPPISPTPAAVVEAISRVVLAAGRAEAGLVEAV